jgi:hypothetical protein
MTTSQTYHWLTTCPNPRSRPTSFDAGQRGWKLHAVLATPEDTTRTLGWRNAACGLMPTHGWSLDMFIDDRCARCVAALVKLEAQGDGHAVPGTGKTS